MNDTSDTRFGELADTVTLFLGYHQLLLEGAMGEVSPAQRIALHELLKRSERLGIILREWALHREKPPERS